MYQSIMILSIYSTAGGKVSPCLTVSHGIPQITTGDIVSRQFCGNHPCLKISVIIPGRQPCLMVITEIFRNGPYYHGTQYVPWEFVGHRGIPWDTGNFTTGSTVGVHNVFWRRKKKSLILLFAGCVTSPESQSLNADPVEIDHPLPSLVGIHTEKQTSNNHATSSHKSPRRTSGDNVSTFVNFNLNL